MLQAAFTRFLESLPASEGIALAVSGGADSMALAHCAVSYAKCNALPSIHIVHVNHGLRGAESDADEALVREWAMRHDAAFFAYRCSGPDCLRAGRQGPEAALRTARYALLGEHCRNHGLSNLFLAHHRDDQVETILLHALRGAGVRGWQGMAPRSGTAPVRARPFLDLPRATLRQYVTEHAIPFREDASNSNTAFRRNWIRHVLLPQLRTDVPDIDALLLRFAHSARRLAKWMAPAREDILRKLHMASSATILRSPMLDCLRDRPILAREALWILVQRITGLSVPHATLDRLLEFIASASSGHSCDIARGWRLSRVFDHFTIDRDVPNTLTEAIVLTVVSNAGSCQFAGVRLTWEPCTNPEAVRSPRPGWMEWMDAEAFQGPIELRLPRRGDAFQPLGVTGRKLLSDLHRECRIPAHQRAGTPVMADADGIIWAVGCRIAERVKCTPSTRCAIRFSATPAMRNSQ